MARRASRVHLDRVRRAARARRRGAGGSSSRPRQPRDRTRSGTDARRSRSGAASLARLSAPALGYAPGQRPRGRRHATSRSRTRSRSRTATMANGLVEIDGGGRWHVASGGRRDRTSKASGGSWTAGSRGQLQLRSPAGPTARRAAGGRSISRPDAYGPLRGRARRPPALRLAARPDRGRVRAVGPDGRDRGHDDASSCAPMSPSSACGSSSRTARAITASGCTSPCRRRSSGSAAEGQFAVVERGLEPEGGHGEVPLPTFPARRVRQRRRMQRAARSSHRVRGRRRSRAGADGPPVVRPDQPQRQSVPRGPGWS